MRFFSPIIGHLTSKEENMRETQDPRLEAIGTRVTNSLTEPERILMEVVAHGIKSIPFYGSITGAKLMLTFILSSLATSFERSDIEDRVKKILDLAFVEE